MKSSKKGKSEKTFFVKPYFRVIHKIKDRFTIKNKNEKTSRENLFSVFEVVFISAISIVFGLVVGCIISYNKDTFAGKEISDNLKELILTYNNIVDNYYDEVDEKELVDAAVSGMVDILDDPNTLFMDESVAKDFNETVEGSYVGIGVTVQFINDTNKIIAVNEDGPADKAGLKVNDLIIGVDKVDVRGIYGEELTQYIKGEEGTKVTIKVLRGEEKKSFKVTRGRIELDTATSKVIKRDDKKIGYLNIDSFADNTFTQVSTNLKKLEKKKIDSLIIDVRSNPGGQLSQVKQVLDLFFDKDTVLYQVKEKGKKTKIYAENKDKKSYSVVVLTDSASASASEILAACFKENYKNAKIVGTTTFGKGTIQKAVKLSSGASVKYTTQEWLTSKGKSLNEKGLKPDFEVEISDNYRCSPTEENDDQLQKAIDILIKK